MGIVALHAFCGTTSLDYLVQLREKIARRERGKREKLPSACCTNLKNSNRADFNLPDCRVQDSGKG